MQLTKAGYNLDSITIRHLLSHTSGIRDYVDEGCFTFINESKQHQWTRAEQVERIFSKTSVTKLKNIRHKIKKHPF